MKGSLDSPRNGRDSRATEAGSGPLGLRARKKARLKQELARIVLDLQQELGAEGATLLIRSVP